jgi:hypothetical protein
MSALHCPTGAVLEMADYVAAPRACFDGRTVRIRAWEDRPMATGWEAPMPRPEWLSTPDGSRFFWSADPRDPNEPLEESRPGLFVHQDPDAPVSLGRAGRWVVITGHREDPAAETCRYPDGFGGPDEETAARVARRECRGAFVIESIEPAGTP